MENITQGQWWSVSASGDLGEEISQSVRFTGAQRLVSSNSRPTGNYTFAFWWKRADNPNGTSLDSILHFDGNQTYQAVEPARTAIPAGLIVRDGATTRSLTDGRMPDYNAWYHVCITVTSGTCTTYINGVKQSTSVAQPGGSSSMTIGSNSPSLQDEALVGYLAEFNLLDGTVVGDTNDILDEFGRVNDDGIWVPKEISFTAAQYGAKGFRLQFIGSAGVGDDSAPTGASGHTAANDFTATGFDTTAVSASNDDNDIDYRDVPTNNHGILNPLQGDTDVPIEANLSTASLSSVQTTDHYDVMQVSGNFLVEMFDQTPTAGVGNPGVLRLINETTGDVHTVIPALSTPDQIGYAIDIENRATYAYDITNDAWLNGSTGVTNAAINSGNTQAQVTWTTAQLPTADRYLLRATGNQGSVNTSANRYNFGQRPYTMPEPSGFDAVQTNSLPAPTIKKGTDHFEPLLYTGNGTDSHAITGLDFQPDLVWIKPRSVTDNHRLIDSVRGVTTHLVPNSTDGDPASNAQILESFDSGGFTLNGTDAGWNGNTSTYVAWCWKAGGAAVSNTDGTITSSVSANTDAGFSIVSYTGTSTDDQTIGHGLDSTPEFVIYKNRDQSVDWYVYHKDLAQSGSFLQFVKLNSSAAQTTAGGGIDEHPDANVLKVNNNSMINGTGNDMIAYCWHSVEGYSKFGSYTGNGLADGIWVHLGFKPSFVLIKCTSAVKNWHMYDSARDPHNRNNKRVLHCNSTASEKDDADERLDLLSNGFKLRSADNDNIAGQSYVYMAFAEHPFGGQNVPPVTAFP